MTLNSKEQLEVSVETPQAFQESLSSFLIGLGASGTWTEGKKLRAFFNGPACSRKVIEKEVEFFVNRMGDEGLSIPLTKLEFRRPPPEDWNREWKKFFKPVEVTSRLTVSPPWEKIVPGKTGARVVWIDPGLGFGTGTHPTTRNCLVFLDRFMGGVSDPSQLKILDLGSGSGILAITAAVMGAGYVVAADTDGDAIGSMRHNFVLNQVQRRIRSRLGSLLQADRSSYHLILANLTAEYLIGLSAELESSLLPGGTLILSGILVEKKEDVAKTLSALNLHKQAETIEDKWVTQVWKKACR